MRTLRVPTLFLVGLSLLLLTACSGKKQGGGNDDGEMYGKHKLVKTFYDNTKPEVAKSNADDFLTQIGDAENVCLIGLWAYNPPAILEAVKAAKKLNKVQIVGFDEDERTLKGIEDGYIHATVVQDPFAFGYESVKLMAKLARDPKASLPSEVKNGIWDIRHQVIKKADVARFRTELDENKKFAKAAVPASDIKVGFVTNNAHEFWVIVEAGARKAAIEAKVELVFERAAGTAASQKEKIDDMLNNGVKAVSISVNDPVNQVGYLNEIAAKVPLIAVDNDAPTSQRRCYIGTNNVTAGRAVGALVKEVTPNGGPIAVFVGSADALNAKQRRQGVLDELAGK